MGGPSFFSPTLLRPRTLFEKPLSLLFLLFCPWHLYLIFFSFSTRVHHALTHTNPAAGWQFFAIMSNSSVKSNNTKAVDETKWIPLPLSDAFVVEPDPSRYGPYPYSGLQAFAFAIIAFMVLLSLIVCGLRVVSCRLGKGFWVGEFNSVPHVLPLQVAHGDTCR